MWLTPSEPMEFLTPAEVADMRAAFKEIEELMEKALHKPAWPIDECCRSRELAADHKDPKRW